MKEEVVGGGGVAIGTENDSEAGHGDSGATVVDGEETVSEGVTFEAAADGSPPADGKIVSGTSEGLEATGNVGVDDSTDEDDTAFKKVGSVADVNRWSADSKDTDSNVSGDNASETLKGSPFTDGVAAPSQIGSALDANQNDSESEDIEEEDREGTKENEEFLSGVTAKGADTGDTEDSEDNNERENNWSDSRSEDKDVNNANIFDQGNNKVMDYNQDKNSESFDRNDSEWGDKGKEYNKEMKENAEDRDIGDIQDSGDNTGLNNSWNNRQSENQGVNDPTWDSNAAANPGLGGGSGEYKSGEYKYGVGENSSKIAPSGQDPYNTVSSINTAATQAANTDTNIPPWEAEESDGFPMGLLIAALTLIIFYVYRKKSQSQVATRDCTSRGLYQPVREEGKRN